MAVQKVRLQFGYEESESVRWGIFHSASDTMFSPTFTDELEAQIFAVYYGRHSDGADYSERAQDLIRLAISSFVDAAFPEKDGVRVVPDDKCAQLNPLPDYYDQEERADWVSTSYTVDELISDLDDDYTSDKASLIMEWLKAYLPAVQKGKETSR